MLNRKEFLKGMATSLTGFMALPHHFYKNDHFKKKQWHRIISNVVDFPALSFPDEKRIPLGWDVFPVLANRFDPESTTICFPEADQLIQKKSLLRITAAIDLREKILISVYLAESGTRIGEFDIKYAHPFQPFQIPLNPSTAKDIIQEGVVLKMVEGTDNAWFFQPNADRKDNEGLQPQILTGENTNPKNAFCENLLSMNSFSPFGWMGGCVHDALWVMAKNGDTLALDILKNHLGKYLDEEAGISFENPMTMPLVGTFNSIEDFLPFAAISGLYPDHPSIDMALDYMLAHERDDGLIVTGSITTEGCYTLAYPMAAIAVDRNYYELARKALLQILIRTKYLTNSSTIFQRSSIDGEQSYPNWGRGAVWYLLGITKTLEILRESDFESFDEVSQIETEFQRAVEQVFNLQNNSGLWYSFLDRKETKIDASATAGIATAIQLGLNLGLINSSYQSCIAKTYQALLNYITPDGFLTHISQINRGGEELQADRYRVISQFGMGLLAQLEQYLKNN